MVQKSTDGGKTFGPITPIGPGYPINGGYSAPVLVQPGGQVDALFWGHQTDPNTYALQPGYEYFTSSADGGTTWSPRRCSSSPPPGRSRCRPGGSTVTWLSTPAATCMPPGTPRPPGDIGYLSYSSDGGTTWSAPVRVTPDSDNAMHDVEVVGGAAGTAYVAWQAGNSPRGYATYLRPFSITRGWLAPASGLSSLRERQVWPGDTFGLSILPGSHGPFGPERVVLSWGSAIRKHKNSEIYAAVLRQPHLS